MNDRFLHSQFVGIRASLYYLAEHAELELLDKVGKDLREITTYIERRRVRENLTLAKKSRNSVVSAAEATAS